VVSCSNVRASLLTQVALAPLGAAPTWPHTPPFNSVGGMTSCGTPFLGSFCGRKFRNPNNRTEVVHVET